MDSKQVEQEFINRVTDAQGIVHKICGMYCHDEEEKQDLFQEIMIQLWKSYPSFRGDSKFSTWMYRVALNVAIQQLRRSKKNEEYARIPAVFDDMAHAEEGQPLAEEKRQLYEAIDQLNDVEKAIVMLHLEEKGNEEIAEIIGISQNYVRVKMTRIRKKLKQFVGAG